MASIKAELKEAKTLLNELSKQKNSWPFCRSVDVIQFPDYLNVVKQPMDLATIRKRLDNQYYKSLADFAAELDLVWSNCFTYNTDPNSDVCIFARELKAIADRRIEAIPAMLQAQQEEEARKQTEEKAQNREKSYKQQKKEVRRRQQHHLPPVSVLAWPEAPTASDLAPGKVFARCAVVYASWL